ncbi:hypothetical protein [Lachnospira sp.]|uniref:hypothetical protein n=1 Tax=Lachnospira sp. TaxID=2049031 RepID=UPI00257AC9CE|nr:hypothetical protein [Lachnospira sp.]
MIISQSNISMASNRNYLDQKGYSKTHKTTVEMATKTTCFSESYDYFLRNEAESAYCGNGLDQYASYTKNELNNLHNYSEETVEENVESDTKVKNTNRLNAQTKLNESYLISEQKIYQSLLAYLHEFMLRSLFYRDFDSITSEGFTGDSFSSNQTTGNDSILNSKSTSQLDTNYLNLSFNQGYQVWTLETNQSYSYYEKEAVSFSTTGSAVTKDGRNISFNLDVSFSREFQQISQFSSLQTFDKILTDPLVISLDDNPDMISDKHFYFDLDGDGVAEEHNRLNSNQGFLALDLNEDGEVTDASELFGTSSGDGFADLAKYDSDGNAWIDEADEIYQKLRVWVMDEDGQSRLLSLKEADVGAIYLGRTNNDFRFTNEANESQARLRQSGFYLHENGGASLVSQIDL